MSRLSIINLFNIFQYKCSKFTALIHSYKTSEDTRAYNLSVISQNVLIDPSLTNMKFLFALTNML